LAAGRRAHVLAQPARPAARRAVLAPHEPVKRSQTRRVRPPLLGILDRDRAPRGLPSERVREVEAHVAKEVGGREGKPREHLHEIEAMEQPHARPPQSRSPIAVTTMFKIDSGKSPSQPRRIAWS